MGAVMIAHAYLPQRPCSVVALIIVLAACVAAGLVILALRSRRWVSIAVGIAAIAFVDLVLRRENAGFRMLAIIAVTLLAMKVVTVAFAGPALAPRQWLAFVGWFGMRPAIFTTLGSPGLPGGGELIAGGLRSIAIGAGLLAAATAAAPHWRWIATTLALAALSFILHFGLFDLVAAFWRRQGVACDELFRHPLRSKSLAEFWSRRWNVGYSEMIAVVVHRPLREKFGARAALLGSFLASGLLHELAISVPVHAGYGLPATYFLLQGVLVGVERRLSRPPGRLWTLFWLLAPVPLLFHPAFIRGVVWPLIGLR
jgi:Membrane bound O-acyl transferase family